jgi:putative hydrolase of the HAD superfamily
MCDGHAVIWDFDGTLAERPGLWTACMLEVLTEEDPGHGLRREDISPHLSTGFPWHTPEREHPELCDPDTWWNQLSLTLAKVLRKVGYASQDAERLATRVRGRYTDATVAWHVFPDVAEALERLTREGFRHVILSNHVPELPLLVERLGLAGHFDAVITSAATGYEKPHPAAYEAASTIQPPGTRL